jgi:hypothetical protein
MLANARVLRKSGFYHVRLAAIDCAFAARRCFACVYSAPSWKVLASANPSEQRPVVTAFCMSFRSISALRSISNGSLDSACWSARGIGSETFLFATFRYFLGVCPVSADGGNRTHPSSKVGHQSMYTRTGQGQHTCTESPSPPNTSHLPRRRAPQHRTTLPRFHRIHCSLR